MGENIAAIIHYYGYRAILLLFCVHQDTESEQREIKISVYQPILTKKKKQRLNGTKHSYSTRWEKKNWQFFTFMELYPFSYYFVFTKTMNLSNDKCKLV